MITEEGNEKCFGCSHLTIDMTCEIYQYPHAKWSAGPCPMATHLKKKVEMEAKALDPIKKSKRVMKGK